MFLIILDAVTVQWLEYLWCRRLASQNPVKEETVQYKKGKFEWECLINLDPDLNLYKLVLNINWQRLNRKETLNLNTYL